MNFAVAVVVARVGDNGEFGVGVGLWLLLLVLLLLPLLFFSVAFAVAVAIFFLRCLVSLSRVLLFLLVMMATVMMRQSRTMQEILAYLRLTGLELLTAKHATLFGKERKNFYTPGKYMYTSGFSTPAFKKGWNQNAVFF